MRGKADNRRNDVRSQRKESTTAHKIKREEDGQCQTGGGMLYQEEEVKMLRRKHRELVKVGPSFFHILLLLLFLERGSRFFSSIFCEGVVVEFPAAPSRKKKESVS
jgi:hypothetical protein